jgi:uncharacterized protein
VGQCDCGACASISAQAKTYAFIPPDALPAPKLSAWVQTTNKCNLDCAYCYIKPLNNHNQVTSITRKTGYAVVDSIIRSASIHNYHAIRLKYSGGEPLLQFPMILDLHHYAEIQARQQGLKLEGVILSNGTLLTPDVAKQMLAMDLNLMISLDGIEDMHDCHRSYPDGHGSFADVVRAVEIAGKEGLIPDISITVSGRNAQGIPGIVAWVLRRDLPFSLNFYRTHQTLGQNPDLRLEESRIIDGILEAYKVIEENLPDRCLLTSLVDRANLLMPHIHTCSACKDYLVFDTQGRVSKCQMEMSRSVADCNCADPLEVVRNSKVGVQNLSVDQKAECHTCKWRYWCGGGCPLEIFRQTGSYEKKSPNCNIYKTLYPEIIRLEGLRLQKLGKISACRCGEVG